jgi:hypothetical protein
VEEEEGEVVEFDGEGAAGEEEVDSEKLFDTLSGSACGLPWTNL